MARALLSINCAQVETNLIKLPENRFAHTFYPHILFLYICYKYKYTYAFTYRIECLYVTVNAFKLSHIKRNRPFCVCAHVAFYSSPLLPPLIPIRPVCALIHNREIINLMARRRRRGNGIVIS